jgi:hypothetical protein
MTYWYCRECRIIYSETQLLPGWDGWWCSNCIWSSVEAVTPPEQDSARCSVLGSKKALSASEPSTEH